jgi:hypothetical protein
MGKNSIGILAFIMFTTGTLWQFNLIPDVNLVRAQTNTPVFTPQAALPSVWPLQSNNIVNTKVVYDIIFRTGSTGIVKNIELTFPLGTYRGSTIRREWYRSWFGINKWTEIDIFYN